MSLGPWLSTPSVAVMGSKRHSYQCYLLEPGRRCNSGILGGAILGINNPTRVTTIRAMVLDPNVIRGNLSADVYSAANLASLSLL